MIWERPWALVLLAAVPALLWLTARSRAPLDRGPRLAHASLQAVAFAALVVALAGPWAAGAVAPRRVALALPGADAAAIAAWRDATPHADPFVVVAAGDAPRIGAPGASAVPPVRRAGAADLDAALAAVGGIDDPSGPLDVAILGAARHDGPSLAPHVARLAARGARVHVRSRPEPDDAPRLVAVRHPARIDVGEAFRLELVVAGVAGTAARATVRDLDGDAADPVLAEVDLELRDGIHVHTLDLPAPRGDGVRTLETRIVPAGAPPAADLHAERTALLVDGRPTVLWFGRDDAGGDVALTATLRDQGLRVERGDATTGVGTAGSTPESADVVVVDDLAADSWPTEVQARIAAAIVERGLGLLVAGREGNAGPGGYADSPLAPLLPVDTPQREERRDPSVALVVIIDTSGSMGNRVELAKEVARLSIRRLLPHDKVGIVEFYGSKRWAAPLQPASNVIELMRALNRMQAGGGTVIYSAIEESYYALLNVDTRFKHVLVLTDGGVETGPFEALARRMASAGINLNTVLIGPQSNSNFLMNLAQWGRGRFYACPSRFQLPDLRFKEPQTTLLPAVQERPVGVAAAGVAESTAAFADGAARTLGGFVDIRVRDHAETLLNAPGEDRPLLAAWDQGAGRVAVLATDLLGPATDDVRAAEGGWATLLGDQLRSLAQPRRAARPHLEVAAWPSGLDVVLHDAARAGPSATLRAVAAGAEVATVTLDRIAPGRFRTTLRWPAEGPLLLETDGTDAARAAVLRPAPRAGRGLPVGDVLAAMATATGGSTSGPLPVDPPPAAGRGHVRRDVPWIAVGVVAFLLSILARRWPARGSRQRGAAPLASPGAAVALTLAALSGVPLAAQDPATDPVAIAERIDAELRATGSLDALRDAWRDGSPAQRLALARAEGDLAAVLRICDEAPERFAVLRILALEASGQLAAARDAVRAAIESAGDAAERAAWLLRLAELDAALGADAATVATALRAAVDANPDAAFRAAVGHLAADLGAIDLALAWHQPAADDDAGTAARMAMRRAIWAERADQVDVALREWDLASSAAPTARDRRFATARLLDLAGRSDRLAALAGDWLANAPELPAERRAGLLDALRELGRGAEALDLLRLPNFADDAALQREALSIAVGAGLVDRAIATARTQLDAEPERVELRIALALLLTDRLEREAASAVLRAGIATSARRADLLRIVQAAGELGDRAAFAAGLDAIRASGEPRDQLEALLLEVGDLQRRLQNEAAAELLLAARERFTEPAHRVRIGEALESLGRIDPAIALYTEAHAATGAEDLALRLAWLLSQGSKEDRERSQQLFRQIWLEAGSEARRVQAEERVLDLAGREGTLADLAIELEEAVADPATPHRDAKRQALVKIWARAQDSFGAREVLLDWAREAPEHEIEAWQRLATIHLENQEFVAHEKALRRLIELDPERELDYRQQLALGFLERGRPGDARRVIREMLDGDGEPTPIAFEFSAGIYALAGRPEDAARLYRRALANHPDRIETLLLWANQVAASGDAARAVGRFVDILLDPEIEDDLFLVAVDGLMNLEAAPAALRYAERALRRRIAVRPDKVYLQRALQDVLEMLAATEERRASLELTLVSAGLQRTAWLRELMDESDRVGDRPGFLRHARALLASGDEVPPAVFLQIGETRLAADDLRGAERAFERARLAPDFARVERRIAELFEGRGLLDDAERVRRRILRRDPTSPDALLALARVVERQGDRPAALPLFRDAALGLFAGLDLVAAAAEARGRDTRNRDTDAPTWDAAVLGVLRCADAAADTAPLREQIRARLAAATELPAAARLDLVSRLRRLATAWNDAAARAEVRTLEASLLDAHGDDAEIRSAVVTARIDDGDLDGAAAAIEGLAETAAAPLRRRLGLLRGDAAAVAATLVDADPRQRAEAIRDLAVAGLDACVTAIVAELDALAADEPTSAHLAARDRARALAGLPRDEAEAARLALAEALDDDGGALRARVSRITSALQRAPDVAPARRTEILSGLARDVAAAGDTNAAFVLLGAAADDLPTELAAPLVPLVFDESLRSFAVPQRIGFLTRLDDAAAIEVLDRTLRRFDADERRTTVLRILADGGAPPAVQRALAQTLRLDELAPADRSWLTRAATEADLDAQAAELLLTAMRRDLADDPRTALLTARRSDGDARLEALRRAADRLAAVQEPDYDVERAADAIARLADPAQRDAVLERLDAVDSGGARFAAGVLHAAAGRPAVAAERFEAVARRQPDNVTALNRARELLVELGERERAIVLLRGYLDRVAKIYPHYAGELATLQLEQGDPAAAIATLKRADDTYNSNGALWLAAIARLDDPVARGREARQWLQSVQSGNSAVRMVTLIRNAGVSSGRHSVGDVLTTDRLAPLAAAASDAVSDDGDVLARFPEGADIAQAMLRATPVAERDARIDLYRGLLGGAARIDAADELIAAAVADLAERSHDAEALRRVLAAGQLGLPVDDALLRRAIQRRALTASRDLVGLLDAIDTAHARGFDDLRDRLLRVALADRGPLRSYTLRSRLPRLFAIAAAHAPALLTGVVPRGEAADPHLDGPLLAELVLQADPEELAAAFRTVPEQFLERGQAHWQAGLALPWCGLALRRGDATAAIAALGVDDPQLDRGDQFPAVALAAAVPPLELWSDPARTADAAAALLERIEATTGGPAALAFRVAALLAIRLDAAGRGDEAAALRARLAGFGALATAHAAWLEPRG